MAIKLWTQEIDKTVDWGGDINTGGLPVSGEFVQKFIKDTLAKKFGYMYYDDSNNMYLVFADEDDYNAYVKDPINNSNLLLASFDAPAPATFSIFDSSTTSVTTLLNAKGKKIYFNYIIKDKSGVLSGESISLVMLIRHSGNTQSYSKTIHADKENFNKETVGTHVELELDDYLTDEGDYDIIINLNGTNNKTSASLTFFYSVVNLDIALDNFNYYKPFSSDSDSFEIPYTPLGAPKINKNLEVFIDGKPLNQDGLGYSAPFNSGDFIGATNTSKYLTLYNKDVNHEIVTTEGDVAKFAPGKHSIQLRISIPGEQVGKPFYSKTKYFDFVVEDPNATTKPTYILYATEFDTVENESGGYDIYDNTKPIEITEQQYNEVSLSVAVIDINGRTVPINYDISNVTDPENIIKYDTIQHDAENQSIHEFNYVFTDKGNYTLAISDGFTNKVQLNVNINVTDLNIVGENIAEQDQDNLLVKYSALNRSNGEVNKDVWENSSVRHSNNKYPAQFNNVLWNNQSGWNGEALVLKNGATVKLPVDLFGLMGELGLTFEIDFETFDVQNDDAVIMDIKDDGIINKSYIKITATSAQLNSNKDISLKTNFKDNSRNKIAFTFNPTANLDENNSTASLSGNPNLLMIYVNGVLDRAGRWGNGTVNSDSVTWTNPNPENQCILIGNTTGEAGIKIYNIRIYRSSFEPEQAFMNYVIDQGKNIKKILDKNHVLNEDGTGNIDFSLVKDKIPTIVLSTDYVGINNQKDKKNNTQYDMQYYDPIDPTLNFYVRNGWLSCQGTSSMNYPTKNLRPYFNKQKNEKTFPFTISEGTSPLIQELKTNGADLSPVYNTEFWPVSEYKGHEDEVATWLDENGVLPYAVNKKEVIKDKEFKTDNGDNEFHEIGKGLLNSYKIDLAVNYFKVDKNGQRLPDTEIYYLDGQVNIGTEAKPKMVDHYAILNLEPNQSVREAITDLVNSGKSLYISAYRPLRRTDMTNDEYWSYVRQLRYSGQKIFTKEEIKNDEGEVIGLRFNKAKKLSADKEYYGLGCVWRQYAEPKHYSGWTDRWTLKADYAESSMTHNAGIGRLWGNALKNLWLDGINVGATGAQEHRNKTDFSQPDYIDFRTSCDGKPIVLFVKNPVGYDSETGKVIYGDPEFAGLFNIMTDKSSVELFGFKTVKDENNSTLFDASKVQCWEFLQNGSKIATGNSLEFDNENSTTYENATMVTEQSGDKVEEMGLNIGENRPVFTDFEPRWPEDGSEHHSSEDDPYWKNFCQNDVFGVETNYFESFWNWLHFTKPAVIYTIDGKSGYDFSPYVPFTDINYADIIEYRGTASSDTSDPNFIPGHEIYIKWNNSGNDAYSKEGEKYKTGKILKDPETGLKYDEEKIFEFDVNKLGQTYYWFDSSVDNENISLTPNDTEKIGKDIYEVPIYGFDANNRFIDPETGSIDQQTANNYRVTVYMTRNGRTYTYTDSYGKEVIYNGGDIEDTNYMKSGNESYANKTYMQFFSTTKYDHLDVYKVAAYYVYVMRFGAVDQMVKNCMMTTEDGQHWYFINYDNDTILGVRNDAQLVFNWDFDRTTWDPSGNNYAYAGNKSILWNNLSQDADFQEIVKKVDAVMYSSRLLSAKVVLEYLDEKQMGAWCERLYNAQEQIKYLTTFKDNFENNKYLLFMQGTRQSHRNWWVNHRWELFDAMWTNGSYAENRIKFYQVNNDASTNNLTEYLRITAASKYTFKVEKNNKQFDVPNHPGFVELNAGENYGFVANTGIAIGDPMTFIGPQKVKVLNFRPGVKWLSATLALNEPIKYTDPDTGEVIRSNWVKESGTMMTKLLIGNGSISCPVSLINGIDNITSLEEVDLRGCRLLSSSPIITSLANLHIFRASDSAVTIFEPAKGAILQEVSLPSVNEASNGTAYVVDEDNNFIPILDEEGNQRYDEDGNPMYETIEVTNVYALQSLILDNTVFTAPNYSEYVVYQPGDNGDSLPYSIDEEGNLSGIYTNTNAYKYTSNSKAIFDAQPTARLTNVVFKNVSGFDTKRFVLEWRNIVINSGQSISSRVVTLNNIDWEDITVSELIEFRFGKKLVDGVEQNVATFNIQEFSGKVKVKSDNPENSTITIDEYNRLVRLFNTDNQDVFTPGGAALFITCNEGIFYQPTEDTKQIEISSFDDNSRAFNYITETIGNKVYQVIRGDEFKVKATIFPNDGTKYVYVLSVFNGNQVASISPSRSTNEGESFIYRNPNGGAELINYDNNTAILKFSEFTPTNNIYAITVCKLENDTPNFSTSAVTASKNKDYNIFIGSVDRIIPTQANISSSIDDTEYPGNIGNSSSESASIKYTFKDQEEHTIKFNLPQTTNSNVKDILVSFDISSDAETIVFNKENNKIKFNVDENKVVSLNFTPVLPQTNTHKIKCIVTLVFDTAVTEKQKVNKYFYFTPNSVYANTANVIINENTINNGDTYQINQTGDYEFKVNIGPDNYNIPINSIRVTRKHIIYNNDYVKYFNGEEEFIGISSNEESMEYNDAKNTIFKVSINNPEHKSFAIKDEITIRIVDKYEQSPVECTFILDTRIIYPEKTYIAIEDYIQQHIDEYIKTGDVDNVIDITVLNAQGTKNGNNLSAFTSLMPPRIIGDNDVIYAKVLPKKYEVFDNELYEFEPTEPYTVNIINDTIQYISESGIATDNVNIKVVSGESNKFAITINAISGQVGVVTIKGDYTITYDKDNNPETDDEPTLYHFEINVHYTLASSTTYKKLAPNNIYLVDDECNYYLINVIDTGDQFVVDTDSQHRIDLVNTGGHKFVGIGTTIKPEENSSNIYAHFIALVDNSENNYSLGDIFSDYINDYKANYASVEYNGIPIDTNADHIVDNCPTMWFYGNINTAIGINSTVYKPERDNDNEFNGLDNTDYWYELLSQAADYSISGFNTIYSKFGNITSNTSPGQRRSGKLLLYIPTYKELSFIFGGQKVFIEKIDAVIDCINESNSRYAGYFTPYYCMKLSDIFMTINNFGKFSQNEPGSRLINSVPGYFNDGNTADNDDKIALILTSDSANENGIQCLYRIFDYNDGSGNFANIQDASSYKFQFDINPTPYYGMYMAVSILPFLKVS